MTKTILIILIFITFNAHADWLKLDQDSKSIIYIDNIERKGNSIVYFKQLFDFFNPPVKSVKSMTVSHILNCNKRKIRTVRVNSYEKPMAKGNIVDSFTPDLTYKRRWN